MQAEEGNILEAGRDGGVKTHEESVREVGQPYFVASKWEEKSGGKCGGDQSAVRRRELRRCEESASVHVTRKDMDALLRKVKQLTEIVENAGKMLLEEGNGRRGERNEGVNPRKWLRMMRWTGRGKKGNEPSVDEQMRNLTEEVAGMSLRVERLE